MAHTTSVAAISLALYMGFKQIGVIGVDLYDHLMEEFVTDIDKAVYKLKGHGLEIGSEILNLSEKSRLSVLDKVSIDDFFEWYVNGKEKPIH